MCQIILYLVFELSLYLYLLYLTNAHSFIDRAACILQIVLSESLIFLSCYLSDKQ